MQQPAVIFTAASFLTTSPLRFSWAWNSLLDNMGLCGEAEPAGIVGDNRLAPFVRGHVEEATALSGVMVAVGVEEATSIGIDSA